MNVGVIIKGHPIIQSINQYMKCLHRDVTSTVQTITVHKMQNSKQLLKIKKLL